MFCSIDLVRLEQNGSIGKARCWAHDLPALQGRHDRADRVYEGTIRVVAHHSARAIGSVASTPAGRPAMAARIVSASWSLQDGITVDAVRPSTTS